METWSVKGNLAHTNGNRMTSEKRHSKNYPQTTLQIFCLSVAPAFTDDIAAVFAAHNLHPLSQLLLTMSNAKLLISVGRTARFRITKEHLKRTPEYIAPAIVPRRGFPPLTNNCALFQGKFVVAGCQS